MDNGTDSYRRFLNGDESGFDEILELYHDNLIYFINRYVKNFTAAEDLAADTFMELLIHKKRYSFKSSFKTYLFSIARHKAVDYIRREKRFSPVPADELPEDCTDIDEVEKTVISDETQKKIKEISLTLSEDYATYIHLSVFEGMDNDDIAKIMKKSKKQIANLSYRAKNAMREALRKEGFPS